MLLSPLGERLGEGVMQATVFANRFTWALSSHAFLPLGERLGEGVMQATPFDPLT
jgi:hypothetical protein